MNHEPKPRQKREYPKQWPEVQAWEARQLKLNRRKMWAAIGIIAIVFALACWVLLNG